MFPFEHHTQKCPVTSKVHQSSHPDAGLWIVSVCFSFGIHGHVRARYSLTLEPAPLLYPAQNGLQIERLYSR